MAIKREGVQCELYMQRCGPNASKRLSMVRVSRSVGVTQDPDPDPDPETGYCIYLES